MTHTVLADVNGDTLVVLVVPWTCWHAICHFIRLATLTDAASMRRRRRVNEICRSRGYSLVRETLQLLGRDSLPLTHSTDTHTHTCTHVSQRIAPCSSCQSIHRATRQAPGTERPLNGEYLVSDSEGQTAKQALTRTISSYLFHACMAASVCLVTWHRPVLEFFRFCVRVVTFKQKTSWTHSYFLYSIQLATNNEWYIVHVSCMAKKIKLTTRLEIDKTFPFVGNLGRLVT